MNVINTLYEANSDRKNTIYNRERFLEVSETMVVSRDEKINQINIIIRWHFVIRKYT